jgi:hypothetical protein
MHKGYWIAVVLLVLCAAAAQSVAVRSPSGNDNPSASKNRAVAVPPPTSAANLATAKKMPNGAGKNVVVSKCGTCHALSVVTRDRKTYDQWIETINTMASRGMSANQSEMFTALRYLDKYYGRKAPAKSPKALNSTKPAGSD